MSAVILDEGIVHYEVLGRGRPVIFLHGWVGSWRYWVPAMQTAAVSFRCYALDLWGFGDTAHDPLCYSFDKQTDLLDNFLVKMGLIVKDGMSGARSGKIAIIGHGLGALISILFTCKFPALVDRMMVVNVPLDIKDVASRLRSPASPVDLADWLLGHDPLTEVVRADSPKADLQAVNDSMNSLSALNFASVMGQIKTPCLMVHGQNDPAISAPSDEWLSSKPERMHLVTLEQSGHFPMLDESSGFNRLMADFLALESGADPGDLRLKAEWKRRVR
jgi:pimeloyl-ACP methyl ester carboxylesterase